MAKRILSLILCMAMVLSLFAGISVSAAADTVVFNQTYENDCTVTDMKTAQSGDAEVITETGTNNKVLRFSAPTGAIQMCLLGAEEGIASDVFTIQFDIRAVNPRAGFGIVINNPYQSSLAGFGAPYVYVLSAGTFIKDGKADGVGDVIDDNWYTFLLTVDASTFRANGTTLAAGDQNIVKAKYKLRGANSWNDFTYSGSFTNYGGRMATASTAMPKNISEGITFATVTNLVKPTGVLAGTEYLLDNVKVCLDPAYAVTEEEPGENEELTNGIKNIAFELGADSSQRNLTWLSESNATGVVTWQKADELVDGTFSSTAKTATATRDDWTYTYTGTHYNNKAVITGLESNTKYVYQLSNGDKKTGLISFETGNDDNSFSFAFVGDAQLGHGTDVAGEGLAWGKTLNQIATDPVFNGVEFLMSGGDQINSGSGNAGDQPMYDAYLDHDELLNMPQVAVLGNHDQKTQGGHNVHYNHPNLDKNYGATVGPVTKKFNSADYYFVYDSMLCIVINLNSLSASASQWGTEQGDAIDKAAIDNHIEFVEKVLEETKDNKNIRWKVVLEHQSPYGGSYHNNYTENSDGTYVRREFLQYKNIMKYLFPVYYEKGIDLVLSGHDHTYTRSHILRPQKDSNGNYTEFSDISPYENTSGSNYYTYADGTTTPKFVNWTDLNGVTYDRLKVSSTPVKVTNPDGILHVTGSTPSGSQCNENTAPNHYAAVSLGHTQSLEALGFDAGIMRQAVRIDVTPKSLTLTNYGLGGDENVNPANNVLDKFTIEKTDTIAVQGIALEKTSTTLAVGKTEAMVPLFTPAAPDNKNITWTSSNTSVATVDQTGKVTAVAKGNATITAKTADGNKTATCTVTVIDAVPVTGISLDKTTLTIEKDAVKTIYATVLPSNATTKDVIWSSSNENIATVSANGSITGVNVGNATITAKTVDGNFTATCAVTVAKVPVTKVSFEVSSQTMMPLAELTITPIVEPANATSQVVSYSSSNPKVVSVDSSTGLIKALKKGTATITATADGKSGTYTVNVTGGVLFEQNYEDTNNKVFTSSQYGWSRVQEADGNWVMQLKRDASTASYSAIMPANSLDTTNGKAPLPTGEFVLSLDICNMSEKGAPVYALHAYDDGGLRHWYTLDMRGFDVGEWYNVKIICSEEKGDTNEIPVAYRKKVTDTAYEKFDVSAYRHTISSGNNRLAMYLYSRANFGYGVLTAEQIASSWIKLDNIKISSEVSVTGIALDKASLALGTGETASLVSSIAPSNATDTNITYTSSNTNVATVDQKGIVTAKALGTAIITATTADGGKTATCNVVVSLGDASIVKKATSLFAWSFEVTAPLEVSGAKVYVGAFDDNDVLVSASVVDFNPSAATTIDVEFPENKTASYFKAFIWDSKLTPLTNSARLENE